MNTFFKVLFFWLAGMLSMSALAEEKKDFVVILDPGHGGHDPGALGKKSKEKTVNLKVALAIRDILKEKNGIKVIMTRDDDRFVELHERAAFANRNQGDLFVSIHANSAKKDARTNPATIQGAMVFVLGLDGTEASLRVAQRENSVIELEKDHTITYQGYDSKSPESLMMFELLQSEYFEQSIRFAETTERHLCSEAGRKNKGVGQSNLAVLRNVAMPGALIELDFICNPTIEKFLSGEGGQKKLAQAISNAIVEYIGELPVTITVNPADSRDVLEPAQPDLSDEKADEGRITYRVQFMAVDRVISEKASDLKGMEKVDMYKEGKWYKYTAGGDFDTEREAEEYARKKVRKRYPTAFIIKWQNGKRLN